MSAMSDPVRPDLDQTKEETSMTYDQWKDAVRRSATDEHGFTDTGKLLDAVLFPDIVEAREEWEAGTSPWLYVWESVLDSGRDHEPELA